MRFVRRVELTREEFFAAETEYFFLGSEFDLQKDEHGVLQQVTSYWAEIWEIDPSEPPQIFQPPCPRSIGDGEEFAGKEGGENSQQNYF